MSNILPEVTPDKTSKSIKGDSSDHEMVEILGERGIPIARRTVAEYRDELNILPSHMRRSIDATRQ